MPYIYAETKYSYILQAHPTPRITNSSSPRHCPLRQSQKMVSKRPDFFISVFLLQLGLKSYIKESQRSDQTFVKCSREIVSFVENVLDYVKAVSDVRWQSLRIHGMFTPPLFVITQEAECIRLSEHYTAFIVRPNLTKFIGCFILLSRQKTASWILHCTTLHYTTLHYTTLDCSAVLCDETVTEMQQCQCPKGVSSHLPTFTPPRSSG